MSRNYRKIPRVPTEEDRNFIREVVSGEKRTTAFKKSYPDHPAVRRYVDIVKNGAEPKDKEERSTLTRTIIQLSKDKVQARYINDRLIAFSDSMEVLAAKSVYVANDLLDNGRSEKVKADLAMEFIRHKVGTPVQKVQAQVDKTVHLTFGTASIRDDVSDIVEGELA